MEQNKDLIWDLDAFSERANAHDFVMGFENKLCVFSQSVNQLYTNYNIFVPREEDRKLVILPNPYAHFDTFNNVTPEALLSTGLHIIPGREHPLMLCIPFKSGKTKYRTVPLKVGIELVNHHRPPERPFLPVLMKGDLREMNATTPCLHLHALSLERLADMSELDRAAIARVITERLSALASVH
ncbi:hypothetical protein L1F30_14115 [Simiduia sp. 21SJ11W-1]|uniref:hypothetical protein n=1 Tax=Simiduia sp. 21SJ11W-1 TaxID=2909669 RepID=UPI00209EAE8B|nr:hypothetical protein [Simiduia sp. 21SJ11W-1]UTA47293.1 hypothetical protein L1F30_14115 [Simiduia sp. 21SJ11W-1]